MRRRVAMGLLATSGMNVLDSARTSVDRVYNGSRPCLGRANEVALEQEESFTDKAGPNVGRVNQAGQYSLVAVYSGIDTQCMSECVRQT